VRVNRDVQAVQLLPSCVLTSSLEEGEIIAREFTPDAHATGSTPPLSRPA
jgi:hypothetical protein